MKKIIKAIIIILFPLIIGSLIGLLFNNSMSFNNMIKPSFAPPGILFPIVWTILYILMGISSYLIYKTNDSNKTDALKIYLFQLILNFLWTPIFFGLNLYFLGTLWIIVLIIAVVIMIKEFYKINKFSAYLQIPYLLWLSFALILSFSIFLLN